MLIKKLSRLFLCLFLTLCFNRTVFSQDTTGSGNKADKSILENADIKGKTDIESEKPAEKKDKADSDSGTKSKGEVKLGKIVVTPTKTGQKLSDSPAPMISLASK